MATEQLELEWFGYDEGVVFGRVVAVLNGERAATLILEDKSNKTYPNLVACEFYGERNRGLLEGVRNGELVRVVGSIRSKPYKERWYTTFSCFGLVHLADLPTPAPEEERKTPPLRRVEDDDLAF